MDDRHSLSEPRPLFNQDEPTWQVDVHRKGVSDPLLTLLINNTTLPPRCRKKKVIWKLPTDPNQIPNFGSDEKRRIWELFKQQKKSRRKSSKKNVTTITNNNNGGQTDETPLKQQEQESTTKLAFTENVTKQKESKPPETSNGSSCHARGTTTTQTESTNGHNHNAVSPPPGLAARSEEEEGSTSTKTATTTSSSGGSSSVGTSSIPPPGFNSNASPTTAHDSIATTTAPPQQQQPQQPSQRHTMSIDGEMDTTLVPVTLARIFMDIYYPLLTAGNFMDLFGYYCPTSAVQKSLSVGDAHHVCTNAQEVLLQLQSLWNSKWQIKGIVAQGGICNSVVLLITGTVVLLGDGQQPQTEQQPMSYCHSVTLVPQASTTTTTTTTREYQIHNDAMAFLKP